MKGLRHVPAVFAILSLCLLCACGGGGGGGGGGSSTPASNPGVPTLSSVTFSPSSAPANSVVAITGSFNFTDPAGDLNGGSFNFTYGGSTTTIALGQGFAGVTSGIGQIIGTAQLNTTPGALAIPCWLVDRAGNRSNTVNVNFTQTVARFAYLVNDDGTIQAYGIDASTFRLRHNGYYLAGSNHNRCIAVDPSQRFVYAPNYTDGVIYEYAINQTTGVLTPISGHASIAAGTNPFSVAVDPSGRFAYVTDYTGGNIYEYTIDQTNGFLTAIAGHASIATGASPRSVAIDPYGRFAYVANYASANVSQYTIDSTTGALTAVTGLPTAGAGTNPYSVAVDPTGQFAYVANYNAAVTPGSISQYTIDQTTGALNAGSPATVAVAGAVPTAIAVDPLGTFLYVGDSSNNVTPYAIDNNGRLTAGSAVPMGAPARGIAVDPASRYVYVSASDETVSIFSQSTPGVLALLAAPYKISTGYGAGLGPPGPYQMAMMFGSSRATYVPKYAYVANNSDPTVSEFSITAGVLSGGATIAAGTNPQAIAVDPSGQFAYVSNYTAGGINEYTITAGVLAANGTIAAGTNPQAIAVDPSGRFAYVANYTAGGVNEYTITAGALSANGTTAAGTNPYSIAVDPAGRFVYVANYAGGVATSSTISEYAITQTTGALGLIGTVPTGTLTAAQVVAVEPLGRWVYVAVNGGTVYAYSIDLTAGGLTLIGPAVGGANPQGIAFDPLGRWAYVACNGGGGNVYVYSIGATGALTAATPASYTAANAWGVSVDPSGQYVYVTNNTGNNVSVFSVGALGALTPLASSPATGNAPEGIAVTGVIQ